MLVRSDPIFVLLFVWTFMCHMRPSDSPWRSKDTWHNHVVTPAEQPHLGKRPATGRWKTTKQCNIGLLDSQFLMVQKQGILYECFLGIYMPLLIKPVSDVEYLHRAPIPEPCTKHPPNSHKHLPRALLETLFHQFQDGWVRYIMICEKKD